MLYDFLVVGHGLAGAILAQTLEKRGHNVLVFDAEKPNSASNVAAGLINPVAGKRFAKSWQVDTFLPAAEQFYKELETEFDTELFHQKPILKLFSSIEEQNNWMGKSAEDQWNEYIEATYPELPTSETVQQELGGLKIAKGGYVQLRKTLGLLRQKLQTQNKIRSGTFNFNNLTINETGIRYEDIQAKHLIFCEGWQAVNNPYFSWLPFSINKGEVLDINVRNFSSECIYNKGVYVVPLGNGNLKVGATYNWREPNENPTAEGREELETKLKKLLNKSFEIVNHEAGIRPAVRDRKPLIGIHPEFPALSVFNGMGSKGVLMAPFLASQFAACLAGEGTLWPEVSISRYQQFYLKGS